MLRFMVCDELLFLGQIVQCPSDRVYCTRISESRFTSDYPDIALSRTLAFGTSLTNLCPVSKVGQVQSKELLWGV